MQFGCCGANGPSDWTTAKLNANAPGLNVQVTSPSRVFNIPASCCKPDIPAALCDKARKIDVGVTRVPETAELYNKVRRIATMATIHGFCLDKIRKQYINSTIFAKNGI